MTSAGTVSVIVPCFNVELYIRECVKSALDCLPASGEVICVDNNSTDNTLKVLEELKSSDRRVLVSHEHRKGAAAARNHGISLASGNYLLFLDGDDWLLPDAVSIQLESIRKNGADIAVAPYFRRSTDGKDTLITPHSDAWKGVYTTRLGLTSSLLFCRELITRVGGWDETLSSSQEYDLLFRCLKNGARVDIRSSHPVAVMRDREGQISASDPAKRWSQYLQLRMRILDYLSQELPEYFITERSFYYQQFFELLHIVYRWIPDEATAAYRRFLKGRYTPAPGPAVGRGFVWLSRCVGFENAEKLKHLIR